MIPVFNQQRNFWVVRADKGMLFEKFIRDGFVGIAHTDNLGLTHSDVDERYLSDIYNSNYAKDLSNSKLRQIRAFIQKINIDDWVITINNKYVCIGRVTSKAFISKNDIDLAYANKLSLRREISWGPKLSRSSIPSDLANSLKTNFTVFSINKCAESIYHALFPFFIKDGELHTTLLIESENQLKTEYIAELFGKISSIEKLSKDILEISHDTHDGYIYSTVKAEFNSPGAIRVQYKSIDITIPFSKWIPITLCIYTMLFGNDWSGFQGVIDQKSRQLIINHIIKMRETDKENDLKEKLNLAAPNPELAAELLSETDKKISMKALVEEKKSQNLPTNGS